MSQTATNFLLERMDNFNFKNSLANNKPTALFPGKIIESFNVRSGELT